MRFIWIACLVIALTDGVSAGPKKPGKDFWKILVTPNAKWVLHPGGEDAARNDSTIIVETYDVRTVAGAQVARLRWAYKGSAPNDTLPPSQWRPTQVAVTRQGLYMLDAAMDDAAVTAALKKKPSRSSPPKPYKGTKANGGRYLRVHGDEVCMGQANISGTCEDVCETEICISATAGVTSITGYDAPEPLIWTK